VLYTTQRVDYFRAQRADIVLFYPERHIYQNKLAGCRLIVVYHGHHFITFAGQADRQKRK